MGIWKRVRSIRTSAEDDDMFDFIENKAAPFTSNFTETVIFCGKIVYRMFTVPGMLEDFVYVCQRLQCMTDKPDNNQMRFNFPIEHGFFPKFGGRPQ